MCYEASPLHPLHHALQLFTDALNKGWGAHFGDCTAKGLWSQLESKLHINFLKSKAVLLALKEFKPLCRSQTVLLAKDNTTIVAYVSKGGYEIRLSLCPLLEITLLVQPQSNSAEGQTYIRSSECDSGQIVQALTGDLDGVVPPTRGVRPPLFKMAHTSGGSVYHQI